VKKSLIILVLFILVDCACGSQQDPASEAKALFDRGEYSKGFGLLNKALRGRTISPLQRARALKAQAEFYEEVMGNPDGALRLYKKILRTRLAANHSIKSAARQETSRLTSLQEKYSKEDALLKEIRAVSSRRRDGNKIKKSIEQLEDIIKENPEYYRLPEAYYLLGLNYMSLKEYRKSCKLFDKCRQLRPCIDFYLPVKARADEARTCWLRSTVKKTTCAAIAVLLILAIIGFYVCRPWRWVKLKHLAFGLVIVILWWVVFNVSYRWLGEGLEAPEALRKQINTQRPSFFNAAPGSPGSTVAEYLFLYGLVGALGVFVFAIGISRLRCRWAALLINSLFGLLLFASLTTAFYMRYCDDKSIFNSIFSSDLWRRGKSVFCSGRARAVCIDESQSLPKSQREEYKGP